MSEYPDRPSSFMIYNERWASALLSPFAALYDQAAKIAAGRWLSVLFRNHFFFFAISTMAFFLLVPRYWELARRVLDRLGIAETIWAERLAQAPYIHNDVAFLLVLSLAVFFLSRKWRLTFLLAFSLIGAFILEGRIDLLSLVVFLAAASLIFALIRLRLPRIVTLGATCTLSLTLMIVCDRWGFLRSTPIASITAFQAGLLPMLWYSVYQDRPPRKQLHFPNYLGYLYTRFFVAPIIAYEDLSEKMSQRLESVRFGGIKALYVVAYASLAIFAIENAVLRIDEHSISGLKLLGYSYLIYIRDYCRIVILFNMFIGVMRLFGFPVRDNFNYWILARTPNEHWRRWNMLFREWIITVVFFPIMRSKRWLFVAVMASLGLSGLLHLLPQMLPRRFDLYHFWATVVYWLLNGLAIYVVIKIPLVFPRLVAAAGIGNSRIWDVTGIILTSAFYGVLGYTRDHVTSREDLMDYLFRLVGVAN